MMMLIDLLKIEEKKFVTAEDGEESETGQVVEDNQRAMLLLDLKQLLTKEEKEEINKVS